MYFLCTFRHISTHSLLRRGRLEEKQSCRDWSSRIAFQKYSPEIRIRYPYGDVKFYLAYRAGMMAENWKLTTHRLYF